MNEKTIATIALRQGAYSTFDETMREAARLVNDSALRGAQLAVLPETINLLHTTAADAPLAGSALDDWHNATEILRDAAAHAKIALVLPLLVHDSGKLANRFYLLSNDGAELGHYQKRCPAAGEREAGVIPANTQPIEWDGIQVGGAICVDLFYPHLVFDPQIAVGAELFVIPSYTPGGCVLDAHAVVYGVPFVLAYSPWSRILDRDASELAAGGYRNETVAAGFASPIQIATINLDAVTLFADFNQQKLAEVERHYGRNVRVRFNQHNCIFTLESRSADLSVAEIMREFGLVSRRDHFAQNSPAAYDSQRNTPRP